MQHYSVYIPKTAHKKDFLATFSNGRFPEVFSYCEGKNGIQFSTNTIDHFIKEEEIHDIKVLTKNTTRSLKSYSSGERKIALLHYILAQQYDFIILDNVFDSLDQFHYSEFQRLLEKIAESTCIIQIITRKKDQLPFIKKYLEWDGKNLNYISNTAIQNKHANEFSRPVPFPIEKTTPLTSPLVSMKAVSVAYEGQAIITGIDWKVNSGEFWELKGANGSGKSTLISLITGDNPKAYHQQIVLFGKLRGTGETIWDIKKHIGYFTPSMMYNFRGDHNLLHMIVSGMQDSIGLYHKPSEVEMQKALEWLEFLNLTHLKNEYFRSVSSLTQRLIMLVRAFIKWPPLLILDEPTVDLDDASADLFAGLLNKFHKESNTAIIYVSHRSEATIQPDHILELTKTEDGSVADLMM